MALFTPFAWNKDLHCALLLRERWKCVSYKTVHPLPMPISLYLTQRKRTKFIIKHRKETIFLCKYIKEVSPKKIIRTNSEYIGEFSQKSWYSPTAAVEGCSETKEGIVENPRRGGKTSGFCSDFDSLRKAIQILKVEKLWTSSVPPLGPPLIYGHSRGCFF